LPFPKGETPALPARTAGNQWAVTAKFGAVLINTELQLGVPARARLVTVLTVYLPVWRSETVETVPSLPLPKITPLKRGVNEINPLP